MDGSQNGSSTHRQMARTLFGSPKRVRGIARILQRYQSRGFNTDASIQVANKVFTDDSLRLKRRYKNILESRYHSGIQKVDFSRSAESAEKINDFVKRST